MLVKVKNVVKLLKPKINNTKGIPIIEKPNNQTRDIVNKLLDKVLNKILLVSNSVLKDTKKVVTLLVTNSLFSEDKILR